MKRMVKIFFILLCYILPSIISPMQPVSNYILFFSAHPSWYERYPLISLSSGTASTMLALKLCSMIYNQEKIFGWKGAFVFCSSLLGVLLFCSAQLAQELDDKMSCNCGPENLNSKTQLNHYDFLYAIQILMRNKKQNSENKPWHTVSLKELLQVESLASQRYAAALYHAEEKCPSWLSWLIPPRTFHTIKSFTIDKQEYPLLTLDKENWIRSLLRRSIAPSFPERSSTLQEKIQNCLEKKALLHRLRNKEDNDPHSIGIFCSTSP